MKLSLEDKLGDKDLIFEHIIEKFKNENYLNGFTTKSYVCRDIKPLKPLDISSLFNFTRENMLNLSVIIKNKLSFLKLGEYDCLKKRITLLSPGYFLDTYDFYSILFHEFFHFFDENKFEEDRELEVTETMADIGSYLCSSIGFNNFNYPIIVQDFALDIFTDRNNFDFIDLLDNTFSVVSDMFDSEFLNYIPSIQQISMFMLS